MPVRHVLLGALAVVVLGLAVYLFLEVRSSPAAPQARQPVAATKDDDDKEKDTPEPVAPRPPRTVTERDSRAGGSASVFGRITRKGSGSAEPAPAATPPPDGTVAVKLDAMMSEANKAYDKLDYEEAKTIAQKVLKQSPNNPRMLRIMVSTACIEHDAVEAQKHYNLLTDRSDRDTMRTRCSRDHGVTLTETKK